MNLCFVVMENKETLSLKMATLGFFITLFLLSLLSLTIEAQNGPTYLNHFCPNATTFTRNSTYQANLERLLSSLSSNSSSAAANGFFNTTSGENPNTVYGLFLCRGDVSTTNCRNCVTFATRDVTQRCPVEKEAVIWYDECLHRYSSKFIFSAVSEDPWFAIWDAKNATDPARFNEVVASSLNDATNQAVSLAKRFSTKEVNISWLQTLYSLVQCTPDLSSPDCNRCLREVIASLPGCCSGRVSGSVLNPSCNVRYAVYPFYNLTAVATPAPPPPVVTSSGSLIVPKGKGKKSWLIIVAIIVPFSVTILFFIVGYCLLTRRGRKKNNTVQGVGVDITTIKSLQYDLNSIQAATNKFADSNKLGEGGFGVVYKGSFLNGKEIAVKRLSKGSGQGAEEFKNEVVVLAKLQHRNLVKLLGFCTERKERMLIYEFVPNKSLDCFLTDPERRGELDWPTRHKIIKGIARGLLYLHTDSRLKIIHRDLKASNILLDEDMVPKISDFGMARIIEENRTQEPTKRIVGTYGYISPEFAIHGKFSEKSDVFSFGVLMLEIVCGKMNTGFYNPNHAENLLTHVWRHWKGGMTLELMDPTLRDSYVSNEVSRCIQIGLLCVQENPTARPTMARIVLMLSSSSVTLPLPQKSAFFFGSVTRLSSGSVELERDRNTDKATSRSVDNASITRLYPR